MGAGRPDASGSADGRLAVDGVQSPHAKCKKLWKALAGLHVEANATGQRHNNAMVSFLRCQSKQMAVCEDPANAYNACHSSIMGQGVYQGKRDCGDELRVLFDCVAKT